MTQDCSRQFLHTGSNKVRGAALRCGFEFSRGGTQDKYQFFVKAMLLQEIQDSLGYVREQLKTIDELIASREALMPGMEDKLKALEEEMAQFSELENQRQKAEDLKKHLAWAMVNEQEAEAEAHAAEAAEIRDSKVPRVVKALAARQSTLDAAEGAKAAALSRVAQYTASMGSSAEARRAAQKSAQDAKRLEDTARRQVSESQRNVEEAKRKAGKLTGALQSARETQAHETQQEASAAAGQTREAEAQVEACAQAAVRAREAERAAMAALDDAEQRANTCAAQDADYARKEAEASKEEQQLLNAKSDTLQLFGPQMPSLVKAVASQRARFSAPPLGPVGALLKLSNPKWRLAADEALGGILSAFIVANTNDGRLLQDLARSCGINNQNVSTYSNLGCTAVYDIAASRLPTPQLNTLLKVLSCEHAAVMNVLIDSARIETTVLCNSRAESDDIVLGSRVPNVTSCFEPDGTKMFTKGSSTVRLPRQKTGALRINADMTSSLAAARARSADVRSQRAAAVAQRPQLQAAQAAADGALRRAKAQRASAEQALQSAKRDLEELKSDLATQAAHAGSGGAGGADLEELAAELAATAQEESRLRAVLAQVQAEAEAQAGKLGKARLAAAAAEEQARAAGKEGSRLQDDVSAAVKDMDAARAAVEHILGLQRSLAARLAECEQAQQAAQALAASEAAKAAAFCSRQEAQAAPLPRNEPPGPTAERLQQLLKSAEGRIAREAARNKRPYELVQQQLVDARREVKQLRRNLAHAKAPAERLRLGYKSRHSLLKSTAKTLQRSVSNNFNRNMHDRGHSGRININYQEGELELVVQMGSNAAGGDGGANKAAGRVKDTRQLSGGERSFTTLCFTLSLNELSESPFCALDEWDVFMDVVHRKVSLDKMLRYTQAHRDKQFILITPQDISTVSPVDGLLTIQKLKPARLGS